MFNDTYKLFLEKILEHLTSPARAVPDFPVNGINNNNGNRNSPCNIYGRSPNENHYRRLSTGTRKSSYADRSGSPCLSGYGVYFKFYNYTMKTIC